VAALSHASEVAVALAGLLAGIMFPPIGSVMRPLWPRLLADRPELLTTAFALDAAIVEVSFVTGPLITAVIVTVASPTPALALSAVCSVVGTLWLTSMPPSRAFRPEPRGERHFLGALQYPGVRTLVAATLPVGFCFGAVEVTFPAFCEDVATRSTAGVLLAIWSFGSACRRPSATRAARWRSHSASCRSRSPARWRRWRRSRSSPGCRSLR
jgi:hypothetical protein